MIARRYRIVALDTNRCELRITGGRTRTYWAPNGGGYVRDVSERPGTLGSQVCLSLVGTGPTLWWYGDEPLAAMIRREARRQYTGQTTGVRETAIDWLMECDRMDRLEVAGER